MKRNILAILIIAGIIILLVLYRWPKDNPGATKLQVGRTGANSSSTARYYAPYEVYYPGSDKPVIGTTTVDEQGLWYITGQDKPYPKIDFETAKREFLVPTQ